MPQYADFSFVLQGPITAGDPLRTQAKLLRSVFPGCTLILSGFELDGGAASDARQRAPFDATVAALRELYDAVVLSEQPPALPNLKIDSGGNNVNRQVVSTLAGLQAVTTRYAVKVRNDAHLVSPELADRFLALATVGERPRAVGTGRILVNAFFTLDPRRDERMLYHVSDWVQVGFTEDLVAYWSVPEFLLDQAVYYLWHRYASGSTASERRFLARYAVEQWLTLCYARRKFEVRLDYHNDFDAERLAFYEEFLVDNFVVFRPESIGLVLPKYWFLNRSIGTEAKCYDHNDWARLAARRGVASPYRDPRRLVSGAMRNVYLASRPFLNRLIFPRGLIRMSGHEI